MAKKEYITFPSRDGRTTIHAVKWYPNNGEYKAILQIIHGMVEHIERYDEFAKFMAENGFMVVGHDHLGHGQSVKSSSDLGYFGPNPSNILVSDMHTLRTIAQEEGKPYFMLGHSMGSYLLRKYLSIYGQGINGAIVMGTGYVPKIVVRFGVFVANVEALVLGWHHRSKLLQKLSYSKPYQKFCLDKTNLSNSWLTKDEEIVKMHHADPKCDFIFTDNGYKGLFEAIVFDEQSSNIKQIPQKLPILLISGEDDPVGDLGKGVKKVYSLYKKSGISDVTIKLYPNDRHEILNENDKEIVYDDILKWVIKRL